MANVPTFIIPAVELDGCEVEPMTTDILVDLFDFGDHSEWDLDKLTAGMKVGEEKKIACSMGDFVDMLHKEYEWTITLRRVS